MLSKIKQCLGGTLHLTGGINIAFSNCRGRMNLLIEEAPNVSLVSNLPSTDSLNINKDLSLLERAVVESMIDRIEILTGYQTFPAIEKNVVVLYGTTAIRITVVPTDYYHDGEINPVLIDTSPFLILEKVNSLPDSAEHIKPIIYDPETLFSVEATENPQIKMLGSLKGLKPTTVNYVIKKLEEHLMSHSNVYFLPEGIYIEDCFTTVRLFI